MIQEKLSRLIKSHPRVLSPRDGYELWAESYGNQPDNALLFLEEQSVLPLLRGLDFRSASVVDLGCGAGRYLKKIVLLRPRSAVGVDFSRNMLERAKRGFGEDSGTPSPSFIQADLTNLPHPSESFDIGISTLVLGSVPRLRPAILEMCRVLRRGGVLILSEFHPEADSRGWKRTFSVGLTEGSRRTFAVANYVRLVSEYLSVFEGCGMQIETVAEPRVDESLLPFFLKAGRENEFAGALGTPVLFILQLRKK